MAGAVPVVSHEVGLLACADLLRPMVDDDSADPLTDEVVRLKAENPELLSAVGWFAQDGLDLAQAVAVTAFVVKILRAQAEVDQLNALGVQP